MILSVGLLVPLGGRDYMLIRSENRKIAYRYIVEQSKKMNRTSDEVLKDIDNISLDELTRLREGLIDPSSELVQALKKLSLVVTTEDEINKYLVEPFQ